MAVRYSGRLTIRMQWTQTLHSPGSGHYRCVVSDGNTREVVIVLPPASLDRAVDSSVSYDRAAHAALSFAAEDLTNAADMDGSGWLIRRTKRTPVQQCQDDLIADRMRWLDDRIHGKR